MRNFLNFILVFCLPTLCWGDFSAQLDRTTMSINETLTLTLSTDAQVDSRAINLSVLNNDFEILGTSPQSSLSIVNGRQSAMTRWVVTLLPKTTGQLTIPAFSLNGETTSAIAIEVTQVSQQIGDSPITARLEVEEPSIYVNEELIVTISLTSSPLVSSLSGEQLNIDNADVTLLGRRSFSRAVDGENWQVNEWQYAVFSRTEGPLHIPAQTFSGVVGGASRSPFDRLSVAGRRILARTEPLDIEVHTPPQDSRDWLPARDISLEVIWSGNPNTLEVGEPMTRTIVTSARGQQAAALPPMATLATSQYKVYADQPQISDQPTSQALTAERRDAAAIVPSEAGEIRFPEVRIPWWDIESETWQEAVLPPETIQVAASSATAPPPQTATPQQPGTPVPEIDPTADSVFSPDIQPAANPLWKWAIGILFAFTLFLGLDNLRLRRQHVAQPRPEPPLKNPSEKQRWQALTSSVKTAEPITIRANLLAWTNQRWPQQAPHTLHKIRERAVNLDEFLRDLEAVCSGNDDFSLDRNAFLTALQTWRQSQKSRTKEKQAVLPELYPK